MTKHVYLTKANDDFVSFCKCANPRVTSPGQLACPWCGCGWLFNCMDCRLAFTFAMGIETEEPWGELARRDMKNFSGADPTPQEIAVWTDFMRSYLAGVEPGVRYVYLDGRLIPVTQKRVEFDGWHTAHKFEFVPQVEALKDPSIRERYLGNQKYWERYEGYLLPTELGKPLIRDSEKAWWEFWR